MAHPLTPEQIAAQQRHINADLGPTINIVSFTLAGVATFTVTGRFLARWKSKMPLQWDDWFCVPSLILIILMAVGTELAIPLGLGRHYLATDHTQTWKVIRITYYLIVAYGLVHFFIKMSILLAYNRIFGLSVSRWKYGLYGIMAYTTIWTALMLVGAPLQCRPTAYYWDRFKPERRAVGSCYINSYAGPITANALNSFGDLLLLLFPMLLLGRLHMQWKKKLALISVFGVGILACVAGILRLYFTLKITDMGADPTWVTGLILLLTTIEAVTGLMCACFPALWPVMKGFLGHGVSPESSCPGVVDTSVSTEPKPPPVPVVHPLSYPSVALQNIATRDTYVSVADSRV